MIMLTLNYALGYADKADKTVGPPFFYWYVITRSILRPAI